MKKVRLEVEEKLTYKREIDALIPDDMSDDDIENALRYAETRSYSLDDYVRRLKKEGFKILEYDESLDSPSNEEIECDCYEFIGKED